jgi:anti-sigma-K factor RskA
MTHDEMTELLGAYALDAVDDDERRELDLHVEECASCRREVARHREVAALIAAAENAQAPVVPPRADVWTSIAGAISDSRADAPVVVPIETARRIHRPSPRATVRFLGAAAAILLIAVISLEFQIGRLNNHVAAINTELTSRDSASQLASALLSPSHHSIELTSSSGRDVATVVLQRTGESFFVNRALGHLSAGRTYQLWTLVNGQAVSLGVLGGAPSIDEFRFQNPMTTFMVNVEPAGGTPAPTTPVLAQGVVISA